MSIDLVVEGRLEDGLHGLPLNRLEGLSDKGIKVGATTRILTQ